MKEQTELLIVVMVGAAVGVTVRYLFFEPIWLLLRMLYPDDRGAVVYYSALTSGTFVLVFSLLALATYRAFKPKP